MGMFDYLRVEYPLPGLTPEQIDRGGWQTKDANDYLPQLETYRLTIDGRLMKPVIEQSEVPEDERPYCKGKPPEERTDVDKFCGMIKFTQTGEVDMNYHGYFNFYGDVNGEWFEFDAKFIQRLPLFACGLAIGTVLTTACVAYYDWGLVVKVVGLLN